MGADVEVNSELVKGLYAALSRRDGEAMAAAYAPEFHLEAIAVAAPAAELGTLLNDDIGDISGVTIGAKRAK